MIEAVAVFSILSIEIVNSLWHKNYHVTKSDNLFEWPDLFPALSTSPLSIIKSPKRLSIYSVAAPGNKHITRISRRRSSRYPRISQNLIHQKENLSINHRMGIFSRFPPTYRADKERANEKPIKGGRERERHSAFSIIKIFKWKIGNGEKSDHLLL